MKGRENRQKGASLRPGQGYTGLLKEMGEKELTTEEWKQQKKEQRAIFTARQRLPYDIKLKRQARRAWQFYEELLNRDMNCHVSVGGLDSITLYIWLLSIGIEVPAISVTHVEDVSIQREYIKHWGLKSSDHTSQKFRC